MNIDFNPIKNELFTGTNRNVLSSSLEFFISIEIPKEVKSLRAIKVLNKIKANSFDFDLNEIAILIDSLKNYEAYILGKLVISPEDSYHLSKSKADLPAIKPILKLIKSHMLSNGFDFRVK